MFFFYFNEFTLKSFFLELLVRNVECWARNKCWIRCRWSLIVDVFLENVAELELLMRPCLLKMPTETLGCAGGSS